MASLQWAEAGRCILCDLPALQLLGDVLDVVAGPQFSMAVERELASMAILAVNRRCCSGLSFDPGATGLCAEIAGRKASVVS